MTELRAFPTVPLATAYDRCHTAIKQKSPDAPDFTEQEFWESIHQMSPELFLVEVRGVNYIVGMVLKSQTNGDTRQYLSDIISQFLAESGCTSKEQTVQVVMSNHDELITRGVYARFLQ